MALVPQGTIDEKPPRDLHTLATTNGFGSAIYARLYAPFESLAGVSFLKLSNLYGEFSRLKQLFLLLRFASQ